MCERQQNLGRRAKEVLAAIKHDGKIMLGSEWTKPDDYATADVADDMLPAIKGVTPAELRKSNGQTYDGWEVATDDA